MPDHSVYITVHSRTPEYLEHDPACTTASPGDKWIDIPQVTGAGMTASFRLKDSLELYGTDGQLRFLMKDSDGHLRSTPSVYQADPTGDNEIHLDVPTPRAVYSTSYRASVGEGKLWTYNFLPKHGHSIHVEYTLDYSREHYHFALVCTESPSAHHV